MGPFLSRPFSMTAQGSWFLPAASVNCLPETVGPSSQTPPLGPLPKARWEGTPVCTQEALSSPHTNRKRGSLEMNAHALTVPLTARSGFVAQNQPPFLHLTPEWRESRTG